MVITVLLENPCLASLNENYCKQQLRAMAYVMEQNKKEESILHSVKIILVSVLYYSGCSTLAWNIDEHPFSRSKLIQTKKDGYPVLRIYFHTS